MLGLPLVVEAACRARIVTDRELIDVRRAWSGVEWLMIFDPVMMTARSDWKEVVEAVPEILMTQPRGIPRAVIGRKPHMECHKSFT